MFYVMPSILSLILCRAEEISIYNWLRFCTVNCLPTANNYQISIYVVRLGFELRSQRWYTSDCYAYTFYIKLHNVNYHKGIIKLRNSDWFLLEKYALSVEFIDSMGFIVNIIMYCV